jgi:ATP-dependent Clp protease, protease subunit
MNNLNEPSVDDTISILRESKEQYQVHSEVEINDTALVAAAILADRYISDGSLPDKAFDLLDRAAARLKGKLRSKLLAPTSNDRIILERELAKLAERRSTIELEIQQAERNYDLSLVAELRYGKLPKIEETIEIAQEKIDRLNSVDLSDCDEEVSDRDIVEIVAELTGNSIERILASGIFDRAKQDRERTFDIHSRLLRDRIIFLGNLIDDEISNTIVAQLLFLEAEDPEKDIYLYINSPGGSVSAGMAILDTMEQIRPDICTICMGFAAGMGGLLLGAGAKGKRMSLATGKMILNKPTGGTQGQEIDIAQMKEILYLTTTINDLLAKYTGQSPEKIDRDTDRDFHLNAIEAKEYGLIDTIVDRI